MNQNQEQEQEEVAIQHGTVTKTVIGMANQLWVEMRLDNGHLRLGDQVKIGSASGTVRRIRRFVGGRFKNYRVRGAGASLFEILGVHGEVNAGDPVTVVQEEYTEAILQTDPTLDEPIRDNWKLLAKRLIAANQLGIRIYQEDGHRWIDLDSSSPHWTDFNMNLRRKQYGSWSSALDAIDEVLTKAGKPALEKHFDQSINYHDDLGVIFGEGVQ